jgi:hypothetical protein
MISLASITASQRCYGPEKRDGSNQKSRGILIWGTYFRYSPLSRSIKFSRARSSIVSRHLFLRRASPAKHRRASKRLRCSPGGNNGVDAGDIAELPIDSCFFSVEEVSST